MTDELKAGRVRKLLKQMMPGASYLPGTRESRTEEARAMAGVPEKYEPETEQSAAPVLNSDESDDDGLLMPAPGKKPSTTKRRKRKGETGTDVPVHVDAKY